MDDRNDPGLDEADPPPPTELLRIDRSGRRATITIDHPPINLMSVALLRELLAVTAWLDDDPELTVVVLRSDVPDWFIAHFDVAAILEFPTEDDPGPRPGANRFHRMVERFHRMDKVTIVELDGRVGGGGSELAAACDMRFGARGRTIVNQMEVPLGILPGGGGTQMLPRLVGRARAIEIVCGADDLDADTAAAWGYLNRALDPAELRPFVDRLADRIAEHPPEAVRLAKASIDAGTRLDRDGFTAEDRQFRRLVPTPDAQRAMTRFLALGGQTADGERRVADLAADAGRTER